MNILSWTCIVVFLFYFYHLIICEENVTITIEENVNDTIDGNGTIGEIVNSTHKENDTNELGKTNKRKLKMTVLQIKSGSIKTSKTPIKPKTPKKPKSTQKPKLKPSHDWSKYKDEKMFTILKNTGPQTFEQAKILCEKINADLPTIDSLDEQEYLYELLFRYKQIKATEKIWLGARINGDLFNWIYDDSDWDYVNWEDGYPTDDKASQCVQMVSTGEWTNVPCKNKNFVLCEKDPDGVGMQKAQRNRRRRKQKPKWESQLQADILKLRLDLNDQIFDIQAKDRSIIKNLRNDISKAMNTIQNMDNNLEKRLNNLIANIPPVGYVYTQLPNQDTPLTLWPTMHWNDVTSKYAGQFFRVVGNGSSEFNVNQNEHYPHITGVYSTHSNTAATLFSEGEFNLKVGNNTPVYTGSYYGALSKYADMYNAYGLTFEKTSGEFLSINTAIKIWQRVK